MYVVTKSGVYQGKPLDPGDVLDATNIGQSVIMALLRQGTLRDVSQKEADAIRATYQERKKQAAAEFAIRTLKRRESELLGLASRIRDHERHLQALREAHAKLADDVASLRRTADGARLAAADKPQSPDVDPPASSAPKASDNAAMDMSALSKRLHGMSFKKLLHFARNDAGLTGDLPQGRLELVKLILEQRRE